MGRRRGKRGEGEVELNGAGWKEKQKFRITQPKYRGSKVRGVEQGAEREGMAKRPLTAKTKPEGAAQEVGGEQA